MAMAGVRPSPTFLVDTVLILGLTAYSAAGALTPLPGEAGGLTGVVPALVAGSACLVLLFRRRAPSLILLVVLALCLFAGSAGHQMGSTPVALLLASHASGRWSVRPAAVLGLVLLCVTLGVCTMWGWAGLSGGGASWALSLVFAAPWGIGWWGRAREEHHAEVLRRAADDERLRIARELHDTVTHALTGIAVQAAVARHLAEGQDAALASVERTSREALADLRRMVGLLRDPDQSDVPWGTAPDREALQQLTSEHARLHGPVSLDATSRFDTLSPGLRLAVHRLVQEALNNVARHAPGASAEVSVALARGAAIEGGSVEVGGIAGHADAVVVTVRDDGDAPVSLTPGHGLTGMRERVLTFGGTLQAGPRHDGGFEVRARLPANTRG